MWITSIFIVISVIFTLLAWKNIRQMKQELLDRQMIRYSALVVKPLTGHIEITLSLVKKINSKRGFRKKEDGSSSLA